MQKSIFTALFAALLTLYSSGGIAHAGSGRITVTVPGHRPDVLLIDTLPFFSVLMGANNAAAAAPQAAAMRDQILTESQAAYAEGEQQFMLSLVKSPEGRKAATSWAVASDKSVVARSVYEDMTTDLR